MSRSYTFIETARALKLASGWPVISASALRYFNGNAWRRQAVSAEYENGGSEIVFRLKNGDFVEVNKKEASK